MYFEYPGILWLELVPVALVALYVWREWSGRAPHLRVSTLLPWKKGASVLTEVNVAEPRTVVLSAA